MFILLLCRISWRIKHFPIGNIWDMVECNLVVIFMLWSFICLSKDFNVYLRFCLDVVVHFFLFRKLLFMKFSVNKKKKSNVYARNYGMILCVYYIKWSMSEERNCLKDKHMLTLVDSEMVLYCKFALDGLILIDVCSVSFFYNLQKWVPYSITVF